MANTTNLNLFKYEDNNIADLRLGNGNMDILDAAINKNNNDIGNMKVNINNNATDISKLNQTAATTNNDIATIKNNITVNTNDITSMKKDIATNTSDISKNTNSINQNINAINQKQDKINYVSNKFNATLNLSAGATMTARVPIPVSYNAKMGRGIIWLNEVVDYGIVFFSDSKLYAYSVYKNQPDSSLQFGKSVDEKGNTNDVIYNPRGISVKSIYIEGTNIVIQLKNYASSTQSNVSFNLMYNLWG